MATNDSTPKLFYIYRHVRHDKNQVFYVGKGTLVKTGNPYKRAFGPKTNRLWKAIVAKTTYDVEIMMELTDEANAFAKEREMIALYGRRDLGRGTLVNMTDGGDGATGHVHSAEHKERISQALKGKSNHWKGKTFTEEHRRKISVGGRGKTRSAETKRRMSASQRGKTTTPETRYKQSVANIGKHHTEETKRKIGDSERGPLHHLYGKQHTAEAKAKMRLAKLGRKASDETKLKMSAAAKGKVFTAEHRRKLSESQRGPLNHQFGKHPTEETRKKMSTSHKARIKEPKEPRP